MNTVNMRVVSERRRATYHHGDLRRALVETTIAMLGEGNHNFTLREVARRAGVSAAAPYNHFADKGALIAAVAAQGLDRLRGRLHRAAMQSAGRPPEVRIAALTEAYVRFAFDLPAHFDLMFGPEVAANRTEALHAEADRTRHVLRDLLVRWQADGVVRPGDPDEQVRLLWSLAHGLATLLKGPIGVDVPGREARARLARAAAAMVMRGLSGHADGEDGGTQEGR